MRTMSRSGLEKHWRDMSNAFRPEYRRWISVFWDLISEVSKIFNLLEGKKRLAENCSYLLLSKAVNHILAMFSLAERGLCVDAALACRNAIECFLLLQLLLLDASEDLFRRWADGEEFKPGWVRKELSTRSPSTVRDVVVTFDNETLDLNRVVYSWLSNITHANLDSVNQTVRQTGQNSYEVLVGGSLDGKHQMLNALFATACHGLHLTAAVCMAVFDPVQLGKSGAQWSALEKMISQASRPSAVNP